MDDLYNEDGIGWLDREPEYWDLVSEVLDLQESVYESGLLDTQLWDETGETLASETTGTTHQSPDEGLIEGETDDQVALAAGLTC